MKKYLLVCVLLISFRAYSQSTESVFVYFAFDKYQLSSNTRARLDSLTDSLDIADLIELHGHCDARGSGAYNIQLSRQRVREVEKYLLDIGWEKKDIIIAKGHGEAIPVDDNISEEGRQQNRRVEIRVLRGQAKKTLKEQLENKNLKTGDNIILQNIHFVGGMHRLLPESDNTLLELLDVMRSYPKLVIRIEGHICCQEGPEDGFDVETRQNDLSEARAKAITYYLVSKGIDPNRISYKGFGHSAPLFPYPEKTTEEQKLNRRVEIKILSK